MASENLVAREVRREREGCFDGLGLRYQAKRRRARVNNHMSHAFDLRAYEMPLVCDTSILSGSLKTVAISVVRVFLALSTERAQESYYSGYWSLDRAMPKDPRGSHAHSSTIAEGTWGCHQEWTSIRVWMASSCFFRQHDAYAF